MSQGQFWKTFAGRSNNNFLLIFYAFHYQTLHAFIIFSDLLYFKVNNIVEMWDWITANLRRRGRRRTRTATSTTAEFSSNNTTEELLVPTTSAGISGFLRRTRETNQLFFRPSHLMSESQPKCLSHMACSDILYGQRIEDFSSNCWLENHLHQFGYPPHEHHEPESGTLSSVFGAEDDSSTTESTEPNSIIFDDDERNYFEHHSSVPRLPLEQLFVPLGENDRESDDGDSLFTLPTEDPPPYCPYNEPPPTYEEAVGHYDRLSNTSRSSSSSLAFIW